MSLEELKVDGVIKSKENQDRHIWQAAFIINKKVITEKENILRKSFNFCIDSIPSGKMWNKYNLDGISLENMSELTTNNRNYSRKKSGDTNGCEKLLPEIMRKLILGRNIMNLIKMGALSILMRILFNKRETQERHSVEQLFEYNSCIKTFQCNALFIT